MNPGNELPPVDTSALAPLPLDQYALIIDARSPHEYAEDHVPGAVNLPASHTRGDFERVMPMAEDPP